MKNSINKSCLATFAVTAATMTGALAHDVANPTIEVAIEANGQGLWISPDADSDGRIVGKLRFGGIAVEMDGITTLAGGSLPKADSNVAEFTIAFGVVSAELFDRDDNGDRVRVGLMEGVWESTSLTTGTMRGSLFLGPQDHYVGDFKGEFMVPGQDNAAKAAQAPDEVQPVKPQPVPVKTAGKAAQEPLDENYIKRKKLFNEQQSGSSAKAAQAPLDEDYTKRKKLFNEQQSGSAAKAAQAPLDQSYLKRKKLFNDQQSGSAAKAAQEPLDRSSVGEFRMSGVIML